MMMSMMMIRIGQNISEKTLYFNGGTREFDRLICKPDRRSVPYIYLTVCLFFLSYVSIVNCMSLVVRIMFLQCPRASQRRV